MTILQEITAVRNLMVMNGIEPTIIKMTRKHFSQLKDEIGPLYYYSNDDPYDRTTPTVLGMKVHFVTERFPTRQPLTNE